MKGVMVTEAGWNIFTLLYFVVFEIGMNLVDL